MEAKNKGLAEAYFNTFGHWHFHSGLTDAEAQAKLDAMEARMNNYVAFYKGKRIEVQAATSYEAQVKAATRLKAKKAWDVTVVLADKPVDPASL